MAVSEEALAKARAEWIKGYTDCEKGLPHSEGKSEEYDRGYGDCYQSQQMDGRWADE